jgi:hypothetical protein
MAAVTEGRRVAVLVTGLLVALLMGIPGFYAGRAYFQREPVGAAPAFDPRQEPDTSIPYWYVPWEEWEAAQPRAVIQIAGVTVGPGVHHGGTPCSAGEAVLVQPTGADLSAVAIKPRYMPAGARLQAEEAVACRGRVVSYYRSYSLAIDEAAVARAARGEVSLFAVPHGGVVEVFRAIGDAQVTSDIPQYRWSEMTINGRRVALARPLIDAGFGESMVISHDGTVLTFIRALHLSLPELIRVSEGVIE